LLAERDDAGGAFALRVRRALRFHQQVLRAGGAAIWYNPAWLLLVAFSAVFARVSRGAALFQEALADRWTAASFGSTVFGEALEYELRQTVIVERHLRAALDWARRVARDKANLFEYEPLRQGAGESPDDEMRRRLAAPASRDESRPVAERLRAVRALGAPGNALRPGDRDPVERVFQDLPSLQRQLTRELLEGGGQSS
jgi:hypothetical protein